MSEKEKRTKFAREIREIARIWREDHINTWNGKTQCDRDMREVGKADARDLRRVARLLREGRVTEAAKKLDSLDTIIRDLIPEETYKYLMEEIC